MNSLPAIAASGLNANQLLLSAAAHNIANANTPGFKRQTVQTAAMAEGGVTARVDTAATEGPALEEDVVGLLQAKHAFSANLAVFRAQDRMIGSLLDERG